ncbi:MAG: periplasmic heavy metal sensor [Myxococcota bacterium]
MTRSWTLPLFLLSVLGCPSEGAWPELPKRGGDLRGPVSPPPLHDLVREHGASLGIRPQQVRAIEGLAEAARPALNEAHRDIDRARRVLRDLLQETDPSRDAVSRAIDDLGAAETRLRQGEISVLLDILSLLDLQQRTALARLGSTSSHGPKRRRAPPPPPRPPPQRQPE